ncbi:MAG: phosphoenolpyruvate synthase [Planctomycetota bacterium]
MRSRKGTGDSIRWLKDLAAGDTALAGAKGANLGEMTRVGLTVPPGFVVTSEAYGKFVVSGRLQKEIVRIIGGADLSDQESLITVSRQIRKLLRDAPVPGAVRSAIAAAYAELAGGGEEPWVAIRSSASAEDLPGASFAGQQDTFLNVRGCDAVVEKVRECWASLFTPRAIFYRGKKGFDQTKVLMAVVVQVMVDAEKAGVMFTVHPESHEEDRIVIEGTWGLGESVVSGAVIPDRFVLNKETGDSVHRQLAVKEVMVVRDGETGETVRRAVPDDRSRRPICTDGELRRLADLGRNLERHYGVPQDIEWAFADGRLYVLQARPITTLEEQRTEEVVEELEVLVKGYGASPGIGVGPVKIVGGVGELFKIGPGDILVTSMTNPDMVPAMERACAIVTDAGGMTCHAAIVSRELGIPCLVGTRSATRTLQENQVITVAATRGVVYRGRVESLLEEEDRDGGAAGPAGAERALPVTATTVKVNLAFAKRAKEVAPLADGVGLLRAEHTILGMGKHPRRFIEEGKEEELVDRIVRAVRDVVAPFHPKPVWYRTLDAPTDEFRTLDGGEDEPVEHNPMLGWRGIRRSLEEPAVFKAEMKALKKLIGEGYGNLGVMIPLVHAAWQLKRAKTLAAEVGLYPHHDVKFGIMVEVPAAALTIDDFIREGLDFASFGSNDLTQYTLALDRNNENVARHYSERHAAVLKLIEMTIRRCREAGVETSICGQAGSDPEVVRKLVNYGISSISANPDALVAIRGVVARTEAQFMLERARSK